MTKVTPTEADRKAAALPLGHPIRMRRCKIRRAGKLYFLTPFGHELRAAIRKGPQHDR